MGLQMTISSPQICNFLFPCGTEYLSPPSTKQSSNIQFKKSQTSNKAPIKNSDSSQGICRNWQDPESKTPKEEQKNNWRRRRRTQTWICWWGSVAGRGSRQKALKQEKSSHQVQQAHSYGRILERESEPPWLLDLHFLLLLLQILLVLQIFYIEAAAAFPTAITGRNQKQSQRIPQLKMAMIFKIERGSWTQHWFFCWWVC